MTITFERQLLISTTLVAKLVVGDFELSFELMSFGRNQNNIEIGQLLDLNVLFIV